MEHFGFVTGSSGAGKRGRSDAGGKVGPVGLSWCGTGGRYPLTPLVVLQRWKKRVASFEAGDRLALTTELANMAVFAILAQ